MQKEEIKTMLVEFMRFCDDRDLKIKDNNFKYFQDYADDFLDENKQQFQSPQSKEVEAAAMEHYPFTEEDRAYIGSFNSVADDMQNAFIAGAKWGQSKQKKPNDP